MINPFPIEDPDLDAAIAAAYSDLENFKAHEDGYQAAVDQLTKLYKLRSDARTSYQEAQQFDLKHRLEQEQQDFLADKEELPFYMRVEPNTALIVAGNLAVALIIVKYEQTGVVRTVVKDFIKKL